MREFNSEIRWFAISICLMACMDLYAQRQMEMLDRGLVAIERNDGSIFISWRLFGTDPEKCAFNLYRDEKRINQQPITDTTNFTDPEGNPKSTYTLKTLIDGKEQRETDSTSVWNQNYLSIPLQTPDGYSPNDASVGDLNGDGVHEIILHQAGRSADNARAGMTDPPILEAYELDGTMLWRINLGKNIREGAHYTQFMVYDLDGDGIAEIACKTADGTIDGTGEVIGARNADWVNEDGRILEGPEYFTIFDGQTGAALATLDYIPPREDIGGWGGIGGNGGNDRYGNRVDRFLACIAYLDGQRPSVVMCRGYYGRSVLAAWDWRGGELTLRWVFDTHDPDHPEYKAFAGQGNHQVSVADVDSDGNDEIVYGAMVVDDDGTGLFSTGLRHGDTLHVSDLDPTRPGLEVWGIHENEVPIPGYENGYGAAMFDAATGEIIWGKDRGQDVGRGVAADLVPEHLGMEMWGGSRGLYNCKGERIGETPSSSNFLCWWDGDLLRELLDRNHIDKYGEGRLLTAEGCVSNNGSKATPVLSADLFGDWREEVIWRTKDNQSLRIYSTTIPTQHRFYTLMHDPQYRLSIAWQNVGYNQPPHTGFYLGVGMSLPPKPNIFLTNPNNKSLINHAPYNEH